MATLESQPTASGARRAIKPPMFDTTGKAIATGEPAGAFFEGGYSVSQPSTFATPPNSHSARNGTTFDTISPAAMRSTCLPQAFNAVRFSSS